MAIFFRSMVVKEPFIFDSVGNHWKQERVIRPNGFPVYHYLQTEKGQGKIEIQGKVFELKEGEGVLLAPFVSHSYMSLSEEWMTLFVTLTGKMEHRIAELLDNRQVIFTDREQGVKMAQSVNRMIELYQSNPMDEKGMSLLCYEFLLHFLDGQKQEDSREDPLYQKYVAPVIKEIETNYVEKLTAAGLSAGVFVTQQYLSRLFRRFMGCSVYEYITAYRISKAKELLLGHQRMEIQNIAHCVGFEDASHFIAVFRKMTEMTPVEFRNLHKGRV